MLGNILENLLLEESQRQGLGLLGGFYWPQLPRTHIDLDRSADEGHWFDKLVLQRAQIDLRCHVCTEIYLRIFVPPAQQLKR